MFLDASVILAVLLQEQEGDAALEAIVVSARIRSSALAVFEASSRLARHGATFDEAFATVMDFIGDVKGEIVDIGEPAMRAAHACAARYHHLTGHAARLNMGDCFAYAAARTAGLKLAYKGNDFIHTDIDGLRFGPETPSARS
ncbi:ribonuclease VapC [Bosea sp. BE125]|uniref:type II toxin-antitoxin system VapC family toxin n=1 Tax=Bosea sp. BE125 TaxID=2817909 RepID=UPI002858F487|nr:type II toxin-antitoxin system VapC family toxin [Bosea sp. BE125]MDR6872948.1 ribonuclease VapC [Bosea sp. BE125]